MALRRHLHVLMLMKAFDLMAHDSKLCSDRRRRSSAIKIKICHVCIIYVYG